MNILNKVANQQRDRH